MSQIPNIEFYDEVVYIPDPRNDYTMFNHPPMGLYKLDLTPITSATTTRNNFYNLNGIEVEPRTIVGNPITDQIDVESLPVVDNGPYYFGGKVFPHYGHFLVETLSRLWPAHKMIFPSKILYVNPAAQFANTIHYIRDCYTALGNQELVHFPVACRIKDVYVAPAGFVICGPVMKEYREFMLTMGRALVPEIDQIANTNLTPLYITKRGIEAQGTGVANEDEIEKELVKLGVEVYFPDTDSVSDQVRKLASRKYIMGQASTALDTLLFCPGGKRVASLMTNSASVLNFTNIDDLCGNVGIHNMFTQYRSEMPVDDEFVFVKVHFSDVDKLARTLLQCCVVK